jgi:hypothetical protein
MKISLTGLTENIFFFLLIKATGNVLNVILGGRGGIPALPAASHS